jgi:RimJ/RimL family protein N-acetyltransferase
VELSSPRLLLRLTSSVEMQTLLNGGVVPGQRWESGYPLDGTLVAMAMQVEQPRATPFGHFQILRRSDETVIGDVGFHGPPDDLGEVSVGFGIVPEARGRGYASEALHAVITWALRQPEVRAVQADTDLVNLASQRVLQKVGMRLVADEGDRKLYEIAAP